jgi:hypothetical protein
MTQKKLSPIHSGEILQEEYPKLLRSSETGLY